ncbi:hypothetical protein ACFWIB_39315 [Streptomyces sp. NPDC127051]|uniref:hypothetical protein n=1 Tax=Streptomyces sp. NPDC127051 TaxID=3347119 RepID=UPI003662B8F0
MVAAFHPTPTQAVPTAAPKQLNEGCYSPVFSPHPGDILPHSSGQAEGGKAGSSTSSTSSLPIDPVALIDTAKQSLSDPDALKAAEQTLAYYLKVDPGLATLAKAIREGLAESKYNTCEIIYSIKYYQKYKDLPDAQNRLKELTRQQLISEAVTAFRVAEGSKFIKERVAWIKKIKVPQCENCTLGDGSLDAAVTEAPPDLLSQEITFLQKLEKDLPKTGGASPAPTSSPSLVHPSNEAAADKVAFTVITDGIQTLAPACGDALQGKPPNTALEINNAHFCAASIMGFRGLAMAVKDLPETLSQLKRASVDSAARAALTQLGPKISWATAFDAFDILETGAALGVDSWLVAVGDKGARFDVASDTVLLAGAILAALAPGVGAIVTIVAALVAGFIRLAKMIVNFFEANRALTELTDARKLWYGFKGIGMDLKTGKYNGRELTNIYLETIFRVNDGWPGSPLPMENTEAWVKYLDLLPSSTFMDNKYRANQWDYQYTLNGDHVPAQYLGGPYGQTAEEDPNPVKELDELIQYPTDGRTYIPAGYIRLTMYHAHLHAVALACDPTKGNAYGGVKCTDGLGKLGSVLRGDLKMHLTSTLTTINFNDIEQGIG